MYRPEERILRWYSKLNASRLYFKDTLSAWEIRLAHCQTFTCSDELLCREAQQGGFSEKEAPVTSPVSSPSLCPCTDTNTCPCMGHSLHEPQRQEKTAAAPQLRSHSKRGTGREPYQVQGCCDFLSPWTLCEANVTPEFPEVRELEQLLSSVNTRWPLDYVVILQKHQRFGCK